MKKLGLSLLCSMVLMISSFALMACGEPKYDTVEVTNVTTNLDENYVTSEAINFENFSMQIQNSDETITTIDPSQIEFDIDKSKAKKTTKYIVFTRPKVEGKALSTQKSGELTAGEYTISYIDLSEKPEEIKEKQIATIVISAPNVIDFAVPRFVSDYNRNFTNTSAQGGEDNESKFFQQPDSYVVGDDNEFVFKPVLTMKNALKVPFIYERNFNVASSVFVKNTETNLYEAADESLVTFNPNTFGYKFTNAAVGKKFKIQLALNDFDAATAELDDLTFEFTVADGWNATSALDLGRINIRSDMTDEEYNSYVETNDQSTIWLDSNNVRNQTMNYSNLWKKFISDKTGVAQSELKPINGLFVHGDIAVTTADFPAEYLISSAEATGVYAASVGSFRDGAQLYNHYMEENFTLNGNLFTIDLKQVPLCLNNKDGSTGGNYYYTAEQAAFFPSHASAFAFMEKKAIYGDSPTATGPAVDTHIANVQNARFIGNSIPRIVTIADNASDSEKFDVLKYSGGLIGVKGFSTTNICTNCISNSFMISWYSDNLGAKYNATTLNYCKTYDSFNSGFFAFRATNNYVNNSEFKRFGGPAMLLICGDPLSSSASNQGRICSEMTVDANTTIESYVTGQEPWFVMMNSTTTANLVKSYVEPVVNAYGNNTIVNDNKMNMKVLIMMDDYLGAKVPAYGKFTQGDFVFDTEASQTNLTYMAPAYLQGAPAFVDAEGNVAAFSGQYFNPLTAGTSQNNANGEIPIMLDVAKSLQNQQAYPFVNLPNGVTLDLATQQPTTAFNFTGNLIGFNVKIPESTVTLGMVFAMEPIQVVED